MSYPGLIQHSSPHNITTLSSSPAASSSISSSSPASSSALIESLILSFPYTDRSRVITDVMTLLHQSNSLKPSIQSHVTNSGTSLNLLSLSGTIPIYYKGSTYHIPIFIWIPYEYPYRPPSIYVTPTNEMRIKERHKHVDSAGMVYLPYLNQWNIQSSLVDLCIVISTVFSEDPPVFKVSTNNSNNSQARLAVNNTSLNNNNNSNNISTSPHSSPHASQQQPQSSPLLSLSLPAIQTSSQSQCTMSIKLVLVK